MKKKLLILSVVLGFGIGAKGQLNQEHDEDNYVLDASGQIISTNWEVFQNKPYNDYQQTRHFKALSLGDYNIGGTIFIGGAHGKRGISWNAFEDNNEQMRLARGGWSACDMSYTYWQRTWTLKISNNHISSPPTSTGDLVDWTTVLTVKPGEMKLCGTFFANEINISSGTSWCDYVFADDYKLMSLPALEQYIKTHRHLPEVPSEKEVMENGIAVTEMLQIHMKKIEELTLYIIELQKQLDELKKK